MTTKPTFTLVNPSTDAVLPGCCHFHHTPEAAKRCNSAMQRRVRSIHGPNTGRPNKCLVSIGGTWRDMTPDEERRYLGM